MALTSQWVRHIAMMCAPQGLHNSVGQAAAGSSPRRQQQGQRCNSRRAVSAMIIAHLSDSLPAQQGRSSDQGLGGDLLQLGESRRTRSLARTAARRTASTRSTFRVLGATKLSVSAVSKLAGAVISFGRCSECSPLRGAHLEVDRQTMRRLSAVAVHCNAVADAPDMLCLLSIHLARPS